MAYAAPACHKIKDAQGCGTSGRQPSDGRPLPANERPVVSSVPAHRAVLERDFRDRASQGFLAFACRTTGWGAGRIAPTRAPDPWRSRAKTVSQAVGERGPSLVELMKHKDRREAPGGPA